MAEISLGVKGGSGFRVDGGSGLRIEEKGNGAARWVAFAPKPSKKVTPKDAKQVDPDIPVGHPAVPGEQDSEPRSPVVTGALSAPDVKSFPWWILLVAGAGAWWYFSKRRPQ